MIKFYAIKVGQIVLPEDYFISLVNRRDKRLGYYVKKPLMTKMQHLMNIYLMERCMFSSLIYAGWRRSS